MKLCAWLAALGLLWIGAAGADFLYRPPFQGATLTADQKAAWAFYINQESSRFGCNYGDDPRLETEAGAKALLTALEEGRDVAPVVLTLGTWRSLAPATRELLGARLRIASMECNPVYLDPTAADGGLIGMPVLPFEEALRILADELEAGGDMETAAALARRFKVAAMDVRWFWMLFLLDRDNLRQLGIRPAVLKALVNGLPNIQDRPLYQADDALLFDIHQKLFSTGLYVYKENPCRKGERTEPARKLWLDQGLDWKQVSRLYREAGIAFKGKWRASATRDGQGQWRMVESKPAEATTNPFFSVTRGVTLYPEECK